VCPRVDRPDAIRELVEAARPEELAALAAELARDLAVVLTRIATAAETHTASAQRTPCQLLTIDEAAERLGVGTEWLYRHGRSLPFTRKIGHRTLRFDAAGLERWAAGRARHRTPRAEACESRE